MSEWWTYRLSDFLLFSARTYYRLFELYNAELWPAQAAALGVGIVVLWALLQARPWAGSVAFGLLGMCWLGVGWAFHLQRYATINWAATGFGVAFMLQGALLLGAAAARAARPPLPPLGAARRVAARGAAARVGVGLLVFALLLQPWLGVFFGRPWPQAEIFGLAPDPTALATLGALLMLQPSGGARGPAGSRVLAWMLWPVPLAWCAVTGATLWALDAPDAWLMPLAALLAVTLAWRVGNRALR